MIFYEDDKMDYYDNDGVDKNGHIMCINCDGTGHFNIKNSLSDKIYFQYKCFICKGKGYITWIEDLLNG